MILGLPGLPLAALAWLTLREPRREKLARDEASSQPSLREVCVTLWANTTFRQLLFAFAVTFFFGFGMSQWKPTFFIRSFGLETGELGSWFAVIYGVGGLLGTYLGGELASRHAARNERLQLKAMAIVYCGFGVITACIYLSRNLYVALALTGLAAVGSFTITGPLFATIQTLVAERMRAISIAVVYLFANLIGMGLGPLAAGGLSDAFRPWAGEESLRYALLALSPGYLWCAWHLWRASKTVNRDLEAAQAERTSIA
jgi:MFS transporter, Spinster family, sphingosine-1-phosphate transporter